MRICIVSKAVYAHGIGGVQDHTSDLARGLVRAGHEVEVVAAEHPDGVPEAERDGAHWRFVPAPRNHMDPAWLRESVAAVASSHHARPFDVIHGQGSSGLGIVRSGLHREIPTVTMFHGNFASLARAAVRRALGRPTPRGLGQEARVLVSLCRAHFPNGNWYCFKECEAIVPSRQQVRDTCRSHRLEPRRVHVVPNGIDATLFRPRPEARGEREDGEVVLVCVGRLNHEKGFHHAVRAVEALRRDGLPVRLVIVGDGEERGRLGELARHCGVEDRVTFAGRQDRESVAAHLAAADVFLFPTERQEAAPLVLPQGMACGLPVVASSIGGITEVVDRPGENGILVPPGDLSALVAAASSLVRDPTLRRRMGEEARRRVLAEYTVERMTERTVAVYETARARWSSQGGSAVEEAPGRVLPKASGA